MQTTLKRIATLVLASVVISMLAVMLRASYHTITLQVLAFIIAFAWLFAWLAWHASSAKIGALWIGVAIVLLIPYFLATAAGASYVINSLRLERFAAQFLDNPPAGSNVSLARMQVGVLTGMGNHCDFVVDVEITSNLSREEIAAHYAALPINRAIAGEWSEVRVVVDRVADGVFLLNATDAPNGRALDFRCM